VMPGGVLPPGGGAKERRQYLKYS